MRRFFTISRRRNHACGCIDLRRPFWWAILAQFKALQIQMRRTHCIVLLIWLAPAAPAAAWPMFRGGPALAGIAPGNLPAQPGLLWTFKPGGQVKSSAAIAGSRVFVG